MKSRRERAALKALLDLGDAPELFVKSSRRWSLGYFAGGIALLAGMAIWNKHLNDAAYIILSFGAGTLLALGCSKYIEATRARFIAPYLRKDDIAARHELLGRGTD